MLSILAYAESVDSSDTSLKLMVLWIGIVLVVALAAFIPARLAYGRRHRWADAIRTFAILWAIVTAASLIQNSLAQTKWSRERQLRIQSGYYDFQSDTDTAPMPKALWAGCAAAYIVLMAIALIPQSHRHKPA